MDERKISFVDHLEELRKRILVSILVILIISILGFVFAGKIIDAIIAIGNIETTYFFAPIEAFTAQLKIAIFFGITVAFPFLLYQAWAFIGPGLTGNEKKISLTFIFSGMVLFLIGIAFGYFILIPYGLIFLFSFASANMQPLMNISKYLNFFIWCMLGSGLLFQLPLIVFTLIKLGIVEAKTISRHRAESIVGIMIICAIITPTGDFFTLLLISIPLILLFEISILAARLTTRKKIKT